MPIASPSPYGFSFTAASLRSELLFIVAERFLKTGSWEKTKEIVLATNELQCRTATSALRLEREIRQRLQTLGQQQIELLVKSGADIRISLAWLAAVKHSSFLLDFAADALRSKVERHDYVLRESDYRRFIEEKTPSHPELVKLSESTSGKVRRVLFAMLREAGILAKGEEIGSLQRPVIPHEVELSIRKENPAWLAAYLVPDMTGRIPDDLLTATSVAEGFRTEITDADCLETDASGKSRANVEILGWLYQFYISEKKDAVMARKSAVPTEDIPAVTQLFTPHWIVRYLVENSLGRLWLLNRPGSRLREHMPYYIEGEAETDFLKITKPEEIRLVDPAVGSGHMLTYAFDLLTLIYEEEGYTPSEIPALILRHNLHGLEICPRAAQLAELALVFKAREKSRRFFQSDHLVRPNITELQDIRFDDAELQAYFKALGRQPSALHPQLAKLLYQFEETKNFGSLIQPCLTEVEIQSVRSSIQNSTSILQNSDLMVGATHRKVLRGLDQAEALTQRYHVVVANPPFMGSLGMNRAMRAYLEGNYGDYKADLFAAFIIRICSLGVPGGMIGIMSPFVWMFLSSYERLRHRLVTEVTIKSLIQPEYHSFFESAYVPICAFTIFNGRSENKSVFIRLQDFYGESVQSVKALEAINNPSVKWRHEVRPRTLTAIPGAPLAYWAPDAVRSLYTSAKLLAEFAKPRAGLATGDNTRFQRWWHEVSTPRIGFTAQSKEETKSLNSRWYPCNSGGPYRKWYGNAETVVNWQNDGSEIRNFFGKNGRLASRPQNTEYYFKRGVTWTKLGSSNFAARYSPGGFVFDDTGRSAFPNDESEVWFLLALMCSSATNYFLSLLNPTMSFTSGDIARLPAMKPQNFNTEIPKLAFALAKEDWDNFETSWDFRDQPLLRPGLKGATLEASWRNWEAQSNAAIRRMQELETENNRLFIAAYGLDGELQPEVPEAQITLARAEARRDMAAFLSYAVGCMMGRYSPDHPGLILANASDTLRDFLEKVGKSLAKLTFAPDEDGIIPVLDGEWFEDDIVARTRDFLRATFGEATLKQNLRFIEDSLGKPLDKYFLTDFYKDHLQTYKKRPIYWLFQSPKKGFSALVYLHRYTKDTVNTLLNKYLRDYLKKLESRIAYLTQEEATSTVTKDKTAARKEREKLQKAFKDCQDWERNVILPLVVCKS